MARSLEESLCGILEIVLERLILAKVSVRILIASIKDLLTLKILSTRSEIGLFDSKADPSEFDVISHLDLLSVRGVID